MTFRWNFLVRGYHCDAYGHVNNARYLELFEEARWKALEESGVGDEARNAGLLFFIVNISVDFKRPVNNMDHAEIHTWLHDISRRKIVFEQEIQVNGQPCTHALVTFVLYDPDKGRSHEVTPEINSWFKRFKKDE